MFSQKQLYQVLKFPKHLQVSLTSLLKLGLASADQVAAVTGKARAVESSLPKSVSCDAHCPKRASMVAQYFLVLIWRRWIGKRQTLGPRG